MVADPVFDAGDPRIAAASPPPALQRGGGPLQAPPLLAAGSRGPARPGPPERRLSGLGFAANRETVLSGRLAGYRIVHFATHGVLDPATIRTSAPRALPGRRAGPPPDGFLRVRDIYRLSLPADLVVLSACERRSARRSGGRV